MVSKNSLYRRLNEAFEAQEISHRAAVDATDGILDGYYAEVDAFLTERGF